MQHNKLSRKLLKIGIILFVTILLVEQCSCKKDKSNESLENEKSDESKESKKDSKEKKEDGSVEKKKESEEKKKSSEEKKKGSEEKKKESEEIVSSSEKAKKHGLFSRVKLCQNIKWERPRILDKSQAKCDKNPDKEKTGAICSAFCLWNNADLVDKGKLDVKGVEDLADAMMTNGLEHNRSWLKTEWSNCQIKDLDEDKKDTDSKCKKWKKYFTCILETFKNVCKGGHKQPPPPAHHGGGLLGLSIGKK